MNLKHGLLTFALASLALPATAAARELAHDAGSTIDGEYIYVTTQLDRPRDAFRAEVETDPGQPLDDFSYARIRCSKPGVRRVIRTDQLFGIQTPATISIPLPLGNARRCKVEVAASVAQDTSRTSVRIFGRRR